MNYLRHPSVTRWHPRCSFAGEPQGPMRARIHRAGRHAAVAVAVLLVPAVAAAADGAAKVDSGDTAWMLVSSALVLMMTAPGLALFYGGLVRRKNVLGTMMHSFILMAVVTVIWAVAGYSLAFGGSSPYLGNFQFAFLDGVGTAPNADYAGTIPHATF